MTVGKRLRFEILKRDGFRCKYCGLTALAQAIHVDHVVPRAEGGTDDPVNLVAACSDCNLGKSDVTLDDSRIAAPSPLEVAQEHAEQIREYLAALKLVEDARDDVAEWIAHLWRTHVGVDPLMTFYRQFRALAQKHPLDRIAEAMRAAGAAGHIRNDTDQVKYFYGCLRKLNERSSPDSAERLNARIQVLHARRRDALNETIDTALNGRGTLRRQAVWRRAALCVDRARLTIACDAIEAATSPLPPVAAEALLRFAQEIAEKLEEEDARGESEVDLWEMLKASGGDGYGVADEEAAE